jgi:hypothetical protein
MAIEAIYEDTEPPCFPGTLNDMFSPEDANVVLLSADGGRGKTFTAVELHWLATEIMQTHYGLTNVYFETKTTRGRKRIDPGARTLSALTMKDLWLNYAKIRKTDEFATFIVVLDEFHKFSKRLRWFEKEPLSIMDWWGENRKFRTVPIVITQKMGNLPRQLMQYVKFYISKSDRLSKDFNYSHKTRYDPEELAFIFEIDDAVGIENKKEKDFKLENVSEILRIERCPWTIDRNKLKRGQICYVSEVSANFSMGLVNGSENWWHAFMEKVSNIPPEQLADAIIDFFTEDIEQEENPLEDLDEADLAVHLCLKHLAKGNIGPNGYPVLNLGVGRGNRKINIEANPTNLAEITGSSASTVAKRLRRVI